MIQRVTDNMDQLGEPLTREDYVALYHALELSIATTRLSFASAESDQSFRRIGRHISRLRQLSQRMRRGIEESSPKAKKVK